VAPASLRCDPSPPPRDAVAKTLAYYEAHARDFWDGTRSHDVSQNIDALLGALPRDRPLRILDLGCGPGRDLVELVRRGHDVVGLDGCRAFVEMARAHAGVEVLHQDLLRLDLPPATFDGIFANASLFHVPRVRLPQVLARLRNALREGGVLFCSNPRGDNHESWADGRYACFLDLDVWRELFVAARFDEIRHYYRPERRPREEQPWLAMLWRRGA